MHSNRAPTSATTAEHYAWGAGCDGWHLVRAPALSVIQERMPPGAAEVRHRHAVAQVTTLRVFPPALTAGGAGRRRISRLTGLGRSAFVSRSLAPAEPTRSSVAADSARSAAIRRRPYHAINSCEHSIRTDDYYYVRGQPRLTYVASLAARNVTVDRQ